MSKIVAKHEWKRDQASEVTIDNEQPLAETAHEIQHCCLSGLFLRSFPLFHYIVGIAPTATIADSGQGRVAMQFAGVSISPKQGHLCSTRVPFKECSVHQMCSGAGVPRTVSYFFFTRIFRGTFRLLGISNKLKCPGLI